MKARLNLSDRRSRVFSDFFYGCVDAHIHVRGVMYCVPDGPIIIGA